MVAPASKASCVLSICSDIEIGTLGLSFFFGTDPVIATQIIHGLLIKIFLLSLMIYFYRWITKPF